MHPISLFKATVLSIFILLFVSFSAFSQAPNLLNYQGVARNTVGNPLPNQTMKLRLSIHDLLPSGAVVYSEIRQITTNLGGLFSVQIGSAGASSSTGTIAGVNWIVGNKFLQVELDPASNNNYLDIGTVQLVSVPYAFGAGTAATVKTNANLTGVVTSSGNQTSIANGAITSDMIATLNKSKVGLDLVNNTSDAAKPISTLAQAALDAKVDKVVGRDLSTNDYTTNEKTKLAAITGTNTGDQDLSPYATRAGVDSISSGVSALLNTKANIESPVFTGTITIPTLIAGTNQYPTTKGTSGQVLTTNGSGTLTWTTVSGGVPYSGATGAVNLGAYDLTVNGLTVGKGAGNNNSTNTASGVSALRNNTTGGSNTATGFNSLYSNTTGNSNVASGVNALYRNTTGSNNTADGHSSLSNNTTGNSNTASGMSSLASNTTGSNNTANGSNSLYSNTTGGSNTTSGFNSLQFNTTGTNNTATGMSTLRNNTEGNFNTAIGWISLFNNTTGLNNTASGSEALYANTTGGNNTASGYNALRTNTTGSNNTALGYNADVASNSLYNATAIGYNSSVTASNTIQLGNSSVTNVKTSGTLTTGTVTYPNTHGTSGQVLSTTGSGTLTWTTASGGGSQWTSSSNNIYYSTGNVGIGTNSPSSKLHLVGAGASGDRNNMLRIESDNNASLTLKNTNANAGGGEYQLFTSSSNSNPSLGAGSLAIYYDHPSAAAYRFSINTAGNVGIGTGMPTEKLDVLGNVKTSGTITAGAVTYPNTHGTSGQVLTSTGSGTLTWTGTHYIGESYGGGIVFYVYDNGKHGLIAAISDQSSGIRWYGGTNTNTRARGDGVGAGLKNTAIIIANQGAGDGNAFAATVCNEYYVTVDGVTYGDWYLPSKHELNLLFLKKTVVGGFASLYYWSSTEYDDGEAWNQGFDFGSQFRDPKHVTYYVRAIRAF